MLEHPFQDATIETLPLYVIDRDPKPIKGQYSPSLIQFINLCLSKNVKERPNIYQLAIKLKNHNSPIQETYNKVSIFNLRHLTNIISSSKESTEMQKSKQSI